MQQLEVFEHELYEAAMAGQTWSYVPRIEGGVFGLAIIAVGQPGKLDIPLDSCFSTRFQDIAQHADDLNAAKGGQARKSEVPRQPPPAGAMPAESRLQKTLHRD